MGKTKTDSLPVKVIELAGGAVILAMMLHIVANALSRTVRNAPLDNTLEITEFWYMPALAMMGFVVAESRKHHIVVDLLYAHWPRIAQRFSYVLVCGATAAVMAAFAYYGLDDARHAMQIRKTGGVTTVPIWPAYFLVPLTFGVLVIQHVRAAFDSAPVGGSEGDAHGGLAETQTGAAK